MTALARGVKMGQDCAVHRHRELVPIHEHHVLPQEYDGPTIPSNLIDVCANGHYSIHALLDYMLKWHKATGGSTPVAWSVRRQYGRKVRAYAERGFREIQAR